METEQGANTAMMATREDIQHVDQDVHAVVDRQQAGVRFACPITESGRTVIPVMDGRRRVENAPQEPREFAGSLLANVEQASAQGLREGRLVL